jgi:hypothetical protein
LLLDVLALDDGLVLELDLELEELLTEDLLVDFESELELFAASPDEQAARDKAAKAEKASKIIFFIKLLS